MVFATYQRMREKGASWDGPSHILSSRVKSLEKVGFDSDMSTVIVDNSVNSHI